MLRKNLIRALCLATIACTAAASAQTQLALVREVEIVPPASGKFPPGLAGDPGSRLFSMCMAPDQSVLILNPTPDGQWALVRIRKWWTADPQSESLRVPGWSSHDTKNLQDLGVEVQVTPDGRYAVAIAGADWMDKSGFVLFAPPGYVQKKPDTIITVVDLERWQILRTLHTASFTDADFRGGRVLSDRWLALQGLTFKESSPDSIYERNNLLVAIPDLTRGPACLSHRAELDEDEWAAKADSLASRNNAACADLLKVANEPSVISLEFQIYEGNNIQPPDLRFRGLTPELIASAVGDRPREWLADQRETLNWDHWELRRDEIDVFNPPFESPSRHWYVLASLHGPFLCDNPAGQGRNSACGCRIHDVSEDHHALLAYCRTQHSDFEGGYQHQWLAVLRSNDDSGIGVVNLSRDRETLEAFGEADGRVYVLAVESGATLRVYAIP
jgi:hypothetical protein